MKPGTMLHRCRLCGDLVHGVHVADVDAHIDELIDSPNKSSRIGRHTCKLGARGVTDLCGALPDAEPEAGK